MAKNLFSRLSSAALLCVLFPGNTIAQADATTVSGERIDPDLIGPSYSESWADVLVRERLGPPVADDSKARACEHGAWVIPSRRATCFPNSGKLNVVNEWGDTHMGIGFPELVDVRGAFFAGQAAEGAWTQAIRVLGFRHGKQVAQTDWFDEIGREPRWLEMDLIGVDRIEILCIPSIDGAGWYGMDDLTYAVHAQEAADKSALIVLDFEDLAYRTKLTGSGYAGLTWEEGTGEFDDGAGVPAPMRPAGLERASGEVEDSSPQPRANLGTLPELAFDFQGSIRGDAGSSTFPPDTDGAIGPNHYVITVNRIFAIYDKADGSLVSNTHLSSFLPGSNGDPRVLFDQYSNRWIVVVSDFDTRIYLAVSHSDDPTGSWFKTSILVSTGSDSGLFPDYETLGVDADGIYSAAFMAGSGSVMSIFAIEKAPLVDSPPSMGTVTAFRNLPWEGAIQPAHTYGSPLGQYFVSRTGSSSLRVRRLNGPLTAPTLTELGFVPVPSNSDPPNAPALGSSTPLNTVGARPMMSVFRDGSLWTAHTISVSGRAGCRWYEIEPETATLIQSGTVSDPVLHYFFPSIMVNSQGHAVMGFTGSSASQFAGCYYTGRRATDPPGEMGPPVQYKAGTAAQNNVDSFGRNRWGDYSYTTLDPVDEKTFWTIQEYGHANNIWGTWVAVLTHGDCNNNDIEDECDLACGTTGGACDVPGCGQSFDCDGSGVPDECEIDCNANGLHDSCDLAEGTSPDCDGNNVPDECDPDCDGDQTPDACEAVPDCNGNQLPDDCDIALGTSLDCNTNAIPDECDLSAGPSADCNGNAVPDECDIDLGTSGDCNNNGVPDSCDMTGGTSSDCNGNNVPDECDLATGTSGDCNGNDLPDECDMNPVFSASSGQLAPFSGIAPQTYVLVSPPEAIGLVTIDLELVADLNWPNEYFDVDINGVFIDTLFEESNEGGQCPTPPDVATIEVPGATFNSAVSGGNAAIHLVPSLAVADGVQPCSSLTTYVAVDVTYLANNPTDCNGNQIPDDCDIAGGTSPDANGNNIPDECDSPTDPGDCDADGDVDLVDFLTFAGCFAEAGGQKAAGCDCADVDNDNDVDLADFLTFAGGFAGAR